MSHSTTLTADDQTACTLDHADAFVPTAEDLADYSAWLASRDEPGQDLDAEVPVDVLDESEPGRRYSVCPAGRDGFGVRDRWTNQVVASFPMIQEALHAAIDMNAEDHPDEGDWWAYQPADTDGIDARWALTMAGGNGSIPARRRSMAIEPAEEARLYGWS